MADFGLGGNKLPPSPLSSYRLLLLPFDDVLASLLTLSSSWSVVMTLSVSSPLHLSGSLNAENLFHSDRGIGGAHFVLKLDNLIIARGVIFVIVESGRVYIVMNFYDVLWISVDMSLP